MPEKTSTASESSLGMMEGLRSYIPNKGWEELSPEKKENSPNGPEEDDFFADEYEPVPNTQIKGIEKNTKTLFEMRNNVEEAKKILISRSNIFGLD